VLVEAGAHQLGPAAGEHVERGHLLGHQHRVAVGQQRHPGGQPQRAGPRRDRGEHQLGRGHDVADEMVLADGHPGEPRLLRDDRLLHDRP
jgi:hypothetical protein